jgi:hypothetical protein
MNDEPRGPTLSSQMVPKLLPVLRHWIDNWSEDGQIRCRLAVDFVNDEGFRASVERSDENSCVVSINTGTIDLLQVVFTQLFPFSRLTSWNIGPALLPKTPERFPVRPIEFLSARPADPAYARVAQVAFLIEMLVNFATSYLFCHEVSHVHSGHLDRYQDLLAASGQIPEVERTHFFEEHIHALEYEADLIGGSLCMKEMALIGARYADAAGEELNTGVRQIIEAWGLAVGIVFLLLEDLQGPMHPPAADRGRRVAEHLAGPAQRALFKIDGLDSAFARGFKKAIEAWDEVKWPRNHAYVDDDLWRARMNAAKAGLLRAQGQSTWLVDQLIARGRAENISNDESAAAASSQNGANAVNVLDELPFSLSDARQVARMGELVSRISSMKNVVSPIEDESGLPPSLSELVHFLYEDTAVKRRLDNGTVSIGLLLAINTLVGKCHGMRLHVRKALRTRTLGETEAHLFALAQRIAATQGVTRQLLLARVMAFCLRTFVVPAFKELDERVHGALTRIAIYSRSVDLEAIGAAVAASPEECAHHLNVLFDARFVQRTMDEQEKEVWLVYEEFRPWLTGLLSGDDLRACHLRAANHLRHAAEDGQYSLIILAIPHFVEAGDIEAARKAQRPLNHFFMRLGQYAEVENMNRELLKKEDHPEPLTWIARAQMSRGHLEAARSYLRRQLRRTDWRVRREHQFWLLCLR